MDPVGINIGCKVVKVSGKPFKSQKKIATVKAISINPYTNKLAALFEEDDSVVDLRTLEKYS